MNEPSFTPSPEQLSAWVDGELPAPEEAAVQAWLDAHPHEAARLHRMQADMEALRQRLNPLLAEPVPEALRQQVLGTGLFAPAANQPRWRTAALAASAVGLLLLGGMAGVVLTRHGLVPQLAQAPWVQRAAAAHAVYVPEVRHPVEVSVAEGDAAQQRAQEEHLARWLTKRLAVPVKLFDLRDQGFELVGGRLLPDGNAPGAQLMYQSREGVRVTVYLRKPEEGSVPASFRYEQAGELGLFYWVEGQAGYALAGALPRERLLALAQAIYRQGPR